MPDRPAPTMMTSKCSTAMLHPDLQELWLSRLEMTSCQLSLPERPSAGDSVPQEKNDHGTQHGHEHRHQVEPEDVEARDRAEDEAAHDRADEAERDVGDAGFAALVDDPLCQ